MNVGWLQIIREQGPLALVFKKRSINILIDYRVMEGIIGWLNDRKAVFACLFPFTYFRLCRIMMHNFEYFY